jgi:hypothetical protein
MGAVALYDSGGRTLRAPPLRFKRLDRYHEAEHAE